MIKRWWIYQRERFPLLTYGTLIAAFSFAAVSFSSLLRDRAILPEATSFAVAFITTFFFFLQLRIADEFKDHEEDARYRPYRPVPRGLVQLRELKAVAIASALFQLLLAFWLHLLLVPLLIMVWIYLSLMTKEFFVRKWLKRHPLTYMGSHMLILPLMSLYATACDWLPAAASRPPEALIWFLGLSFFNGMVFEIGRKIRAPEDEERGVETYTFLWGVRNAALGWLCALALAGITASMAAVRVGILASFAGLLAALLSASAVAVLLFLLKPVRKHSALFQPLSALWTLLLYVALGTFPRFFHV